MRKEIFFAIFAGGILGLIIAFGVWKANLALKPSSAPQAQEQPDQKDTTSTTPLEFGLTIASPENEDVITKNPVLITGATKPNSYVNVSSEDEDLTLKSEQDGSFEAEVDLIGGINDIVVTVFDESGKKIEENLTLVYSTEFETQ